MKADLDATLKEIVERISPAVAEILSEDKGRVIELHFGPGGFKFAETPKRY